ncbi:MAG: DNA polymerase III subunit alpha [Cyclobacteriaceae bacterium]|nr:DNA polymerase III subunit alpha [Cyclobacteriaceae bacterium]
MPSFNHLHCHTQFSLLDGAAPVREMIQKAHADGMKAVALTDHGNMFGAFKFVAEASRYNVKPILGCEFYVVEDRHKKAFTKEKRDNRYHQLLLAKNETGYRNLMKLTSLGYIEGLYSKWPRIDKELIEKYHEGLIATTCCIGATIPQYILFKTEAEAEVEFRWWLDMFGEDYYIELQRHNLLNVDNSGKSQEDVNQVLLKWSKKYNVKAIATNDSHYVDQADSEAHDILLCVNTGDLKSTPIGDGKGFRFGFPNNEFYFKTQEEMSGLFSDVPQALDYTGEIADKCFHPNLKRGILLPNFPIPEGFMDADGYLRHLAYHGAKKRYAEVSTEVEERINHELNIIRTMGFAGYFLITQDMINAGRNLGVMIGPGRGSAAGSVVAYCIGITNIDPIKYNLLFERFLNPERVSMPDIDTDFDDEGRQKVIDYVVNKYGHNQVAQIITYGTMAAKMAIRDVARVLDLPLSEADALAKLVPERPGITLEQAFKENPDLLEIRKGDDDRGKVLQLAEKLEGSVRNSGIHAAGVIIAPDDITNYIPVSTSKDSELLVTQFDGKVIEEAGMLKMDFLGLKTLSIIKDALDNIEQSKGMRIDIDQISFEDEKTFSLYQKGDTVGTFQFESNGMRKYLQELKPTSLEDLIAMNALFRPGPMDFIPNFINRKHGRENVEYSHPLLEPLLKNTYGIMVYQEQIMQTAQVIAGFSLGKADILRRAMGKKKMDVMRSMQMEFIEGAEKLHGISAQKATEIFGIMEKFAAYGFNRSHSAAYSVVAYQTAFLKAYYPAEFMASVLSHNQSNIEKITFFMEECKRMGLKVQGPDVNQSNNLFSVNRNGEIVFGLGAIKGTGESAVQAIISERETNGHYQDIINFASRVNLRVVNKKTFESLAMSGAFDGFGNYHRRQYLFVDESNSSLIEKVIRYGNKVQTEKSAAQQSLFGETNNAELPMPKVENCEPFTNIEKLRIEKDIVGFYISGHPLDQFKFELRHFCNTDLSQFSDLESLKGKELRFGGIVSNYSHRFTKNGKPYGVLTLEDYEGSNTFYIFSDDYLKYKQFFELDWFLYVRGSVVNQQWKDNELEFRFSEISLLSEVKEKYYDGIELHMNINHISKDLIERLELLADQYHGKGSVLVNIQDEQENIRVDLFARKIRLGIDDQLIAELDSIPGMEYKILSH